MNGEEEFNGEKETEIRGSNIVRQCLITYKLAIDEYTQHITHAINCQCWSNFLFLPECNVIIRNVYSSFKNE